MDENSFYSVDRLVEFGLGMAMAQQMVQMMNQTMQSMYVPGSIQSMPQKPALQTASSSLVCYVGIDGKQSGSLRMKPNWQNLLPISKSTKTPTLGFLECQHGKQLVKSQKF